MDVAAISVGGGANARPCPSRLHRLGTGRRSAHYLVDLWRERADSASPTGGRIMNQPISDLVAAIPDSDLPALFAATERALRDRGIVRTSNVTGDLGENAAIAMLDLEPSGNLSNPGWDARTKAEPQQRVEVKTIKSGKYTGQIQGLTTADAGFDLLVVVHFGPDYEVKRMWLLTVDEALTIARPHPRGGMQVTLSSLASFPSLDLDARSRTDGT